MSGKVKYELGSELSLFDEGGAPKGMAELERALQLGADINQVDNVGVYAVTRFTQDASTAQLKRLLDAGGVRLDQMDMANTLTPAHIAAMRGYTGKLEALAEAGADLRLASVSGNEPIHYACFFGNYDTALRLIELGADPMARDRNNWTAVDLGGKNFENYLEKNARADLAEGSAPQPQA